MYDRWKCVTGDRLTCVTGAKKLTALKILFNKFRIVLHRNIDQYSILDGTIYYTDLHSWHLVIKKSSAARVMLRSNLLWRTNT